MNWYQHCDVGNRLTDAIWRLLVDGLVFFDWIGIRKIFRNRFNWTRGGLGITSTGSESGKSLGIDLTGPEKAFDWIDIRKIFRNRFN